MSSARTGKHIISAAKSLKRYQIGQPAIATYLYASSVAGRAGLVASALRQHKRLSRARLDALAAQEGFNPLEVKNLLIPWLERAGLAYITRQAEKAVTLDSLALSYEGTLEKVAELYENSDPHPADLGCIAILEAASELPIPESNAIQLAALVANEENARVAVDLVKNFRLAGVLVGKGLREPVLYSERVWSNNIANTSRALSALANEDREVLLALVEQVRKYPGLPAEILRRQAIANGAERMLNLAFSIKLINQTQIVMADGTPRTFLISPHYFADLSAEFGEDVCDRVKIFLDSIRNGQHFGHPWTGRIVDPDVLLRKLLNTGVVGPCTAIGTDWTTSEAAGIIRVGRASGTSRYFMQLVQTDTVRKVHDMITREIIEPAGIMDAAHVREGRQFLSIEELRGTQAEVPEKIAEAQRAIMLTLREG